MNNGIDDTPEFDDEIDTARLSAQLATQCQAELEIDDPQALPLLTSACGEAIEAYLGERLLQSIRRPVKEQKQVLSQLHDHIARTLRTLDQLSPEYIVAIMAKAEPRDDGSAIDMLDLDEDMVRIANGISDFLEDFEPPIGRPADTPLEFAMRTLLPVVEELKRRRCAIYTRKSTEEGLEQSFNSLDAQREACAAFILSQAHEGWEAIDELYDDGGFSGGSMDRPGLQQLMEDVEAGKIDIIVVYKVDRLTRSLADFARIVDILDKQGASFVSVTQAFNTTNSMGRLTLNVLLSFAQFEREVTGERIRDKIAASKKRGMWMGGVVPLGYEVKDRKLLVVPEEAKKVRYIFNRYLELGSVYLLQSDLFEKGIKTKLRILKDGRIYGGCNFSRGALYQMLANRIYLGEITHQGKSYPGEHEGIIDGETFEKVATRLSLNRVRRKYGEHAAQASLLAGIIWDGEGRRMTPDHASKKGQRYRYYASQKDKERTELPIHRLPANEIEKLVIHQLSTKSEASWEGPTPSRELVLEYVERVTVHSERVEILFAGTDEPVTMEAELIRSGGEVRIDAPGQDWADARRDPSLIKLIVRAHQSKASIEDRAIGSIEAGADRLDLSKQYFCRLLRLAYLAPDITAAILDGKQPLYMNRQFLARINNLPLDWASQREMLGFG